MICGSCRERRHGECRGGSWCDCQHHRRPDAAAAAPADPAGATTDTTDATATTSDDAEPRVNWRRQG